MVNIVFIGGTGRCGTNILKNIFSKHSKVATLPFEYRFLIDPDGIVDFYSTFSQLWSPFIVDRRLKRLESFLNEISEDRIFHRFFGNVLFLFNKNGKLISPKKYFGWELKKHFPDFQKHNEELISELHEFTYKGIWPGTDSYTYKPMLYHSCPKSKDELTVIIRKYIRNLIKDFLLKNGKEYFIEDNTWNIFFARELVELLPEAKIIHIYRDPRDVVSSFSHQRWCPSDKIKAALYYKNMMEYWFLIKKELPSSSYYEIKLESLVQSPEESLRHLCGFIEIPFENSMLDIDLSRSNSGRWKNEFSTEEKSEIAYILQDIVVELGYNES